MVWEIMESPVGPLTIAADESGLRFVLFGRREVETDSGSNAEDSGRSIVSRTVSQLKRYFEGKLSQFDLPLRPEGTAFQRIVWKELERIPYGQVISYGELARRIGKPNASRAVGAANGSNPISIIIPCHRVIGSNGKLTGYGGGMANKETLLQLEHARDLTADLRG